MNNNPNTTNNNQNQPQGSLLRRVANTNNAINANNNQNAQPVQPAQPIQPNNQPNNQNNNPFRSRFGNNNQQPAKPTWMITPLGDAGVRFAFQGIGDPLFKILGMPLDKSMNDLNVLSEKLAENDELRQQLIDKLDDAWETYDFHGAAIMHPVRKNIQEAFSMQTMPVAMPVPEDNINNNANNNNQSPPPAFPPANVKPPYESFRAVDATFVLNILGRVRGNVLVEETPLALEAGFLNQSYICDDPRIVDLALATGAIEESW